MLAAIVLPTGAGAAAKAKIEGPLAVLAFKNLNGDPEHQWMSRGIAETLVSDIRQRSKFVLVERDQIERALQEIVLQEERSSDVSSAAAVGRLVGARTVVIGGYQRSGKRLRITARFVEVETGVILDAAKATGPIRNVFALQDQIVEKLLGLTPKAKRRATRKRKRAAGTEKTVQAFKLYAMAMTTTFGTRQQKLLKQALDLDPSFSYAADELDALERRMRDYEKKANRALDEKARKLRASFRSDETPPMDRFMAATTLIGTHTGRMEWRAVRDLGHEMYELDWPPGLPSNVSAMGLMYVFTAHQQLRQPHLALQVGEKFLEQFPSDQQHGMIANQMKSLIAERRRTDDLHATVEAALREVEIDAAELDFDDCDDQNDAKNWEMVVPACGGFLREYRGEKQLENKLREARWFEIQALTELGRYDQARKRAHQLVTDDPEHANRIAITTKISRWPGATLIEPRALPPIAPDEGWPIVLVLPLRNTVDRPEHRWLDIALARTLAFELGRGGPHRFVGWDALWQELQKQPHKGRQIENVDEALKIAQMFEADVVVLGEQRFEGGALVVQLRKIDVRKARIVGRADGQGSLDDAQVLIDRLLHQLFARYKPPFRGTPPDTTPPKRKRRWDTKRAYRLYSYSVTNGPGSRLSGTRSTFDEDPRLYFPRADYQAVVYQAGQYAALAHGSRESRRYFLRKLLDGEELSRSQRRNRLRDHLRFLESAKRHEASRRIAREVFEMKWPADAAEVLRPYALYRWMEVAKDLHDDGEVRRLAGRYAKEFPDGDDARSVQRIIDRLDDERERQEERVVRLEERLKRNDTNRVRLAWARCAKLYQHRLYLRAIRQCKQFIAKAQDQDEEWMQTLSLIAEWHIVMANVELGRFDRARKLAVPVMARETVQTATGHEQYLQWLPR